jgi:hypothetical protein
MPDQHLIRGYRIRALLRKASVVVVSASQGIQSNLVISDRDISEFCLFRPSSAEPEKICSIYRNLSVLAISDCFTDFLVYSNIQRVAIFIENSFIFERNIPLPTEEQRTVAAVAQANRLISSLLHRLRTLTSIRKNRKTATNYKRRELRR